jgi:hypothetical protein
MEPLVIPNAGEKITDRDFIRLINRAQAIVLTLSSLDLPVEVVDKLVLANEEMISAMNRKINARGGR